MKEIRSFHDFSENILPF
jgi:hypothetical protein